MINTDLHHLESTLEMQVSSTNEKYVFYRAGSILVQL